MKWTQLKMKIWEGFLNVSMNRFPTSRQETRCRLMEVDVATPPVFLHISAVNL